MGKYQITRDVMTKTEAKRMNAEELSHGWRWPLRALKARKMGSTLGTQPCKHANF